MPISATDADSASTGAIYCGGIPIKILIRAAIHPMKALFTLLGSILVGGLVLLGIGGVAYHLFRDDGWLSKGLGALWEAHYQAPVLTLILVIAAFFVIKTLHSAQIGGKRESKIPDFVLFAFIAVGIFFLGRWLTTGSI